MILVSEIRKELRIQVKPGKALDLAWFFKTRPGQYGEGDKFLGVMVPGIRKVVGKFYKDTDIRTTGKLLFSEWHEERLLALLILVKKFDKAGDAEQKQIYGFYLKNTKYINNWDLVDLSCRDIVGRYIYEHQNQLITLQKLADSDLLWDRRIAIVCTFYFINAGDPGPSLDICKKLLSDKHDLIQKANGWMLREIGKRVDQDILVDFLRKNYDEMPRTTLRYAIERFPENIRKRYLEGNFE
jgi:3-methyladenine DNA glycosylase AlkD